MGLIGLGILVMAAVWIVYALFKFITLFAAAVPGFIISLFRKETRQEITSVDWD